MDDALIAAALAVGGVGAGIAAYELAALASSALPTISTLLKRLRPLWRVVFAVAITLAPAAVGAAALLKHLEVL